MSLTISTDVVCDECADWIHGGVGLKAQPHKARRIAATVGWTRRRSNDGRFIDLCDRCTMPREPTQ